MIAPYGGEREYNTRHLMVSREIHEVQTNRRKFSEPVWFQKSFILCHARAAWCCILVPHPQNTTRSCDLLAKTSSAQIHSSLVSQPLKYYSN